MIYKSVLRPLLFRLDAEKAHHRITQAAVQLSRSELLESLIRGLYNFQSPLLTQHFWGHVFPNPVGVAAGFDKNGRMIETMQSLGMGFVEVGSITARAWRGNARPRLFRLPRDQAVINRMGLNNEGARRVIRRLQGASCSIPAGVNIAKTPDNTLVGKKAIRDYLKSYLEAQKVADYITLNISCPNTADGKTFEEPAPLDSLLSTLLRAQRGAKIPTLVKFSSDLNEARLHTLVQVCEAHQIDGYVACNTSANRSGLQTAQSRLDAIGPGGLSGAPLAAKSTEMVFRLRDMIGPQKPIIGVGGIHNLETALAMLRAGANLLQIYTGLIYEGPALAGRINRRLWRYLSEEGLNSIGQITQAAF